VEDYTIKKLVIDNPKRKTKKNEDNLYSYYASFCYSFAEKLIATASLKAGSSVLDPWNGTGTTTNASSILGLSSSGLDLNPVMAVVATAGTVDQRDVDYIRTVTKDVVALAKNTHLHSKLESDQLGLWFTPKTVGVIRRIVNSIWLVTYEEFLVNPQLTNFNKLNPVGAFLCTGLFRTVKKLLKPFQTSNPTWIKSKVNEENLILLDENVIYNVFSNEIEGMLLLPLRNKQSSKSKPLIDISNSTILPNESESIDLILTSPPYCTRIDYGVATLPELATLGFSKEFTDNLRTELMGTSKVRKEVLSISKEWGDSCNSFLDAIYNHHSKASKTYYFKNHLQYFDSTYLSIKEMTRVLKLNGVCTLVVQDSYYKDIHNNLPLIYSEMAEKLGLELIRKEDFVTKQSMAGLNSSVRKYRNTASAIESVLCFRKI
jgi:DNA modification methylase